MEPPWPDVGDVQWPEIEDGPPGAVFLWSQEEGRPKERLFLPGRPYYGLLL